MSIRTSDLHGAGESQIVAPDGTVLAIAPAEGEAVVCADIRPEAALEKRRPDGTDVFAARRPGLYVGIAQPPRPHDGHPAAECARCAVITPPPDVETDAAALLAYSLHAAGEALADGAACIVLPELFYLPGRAVSSPVEAAQASEAAAHALAALVAGRTAGRTADAYIATTIVEAVDGGFAHTGLLIGPGGVCLRQRALHPSAGHPWATVLGDRLETHDAGFGRVAVVVGPDSVYPETFRLAALADCDLVALPHHLLERWEMTTGLIERAAENRVHIALASRITPHGASAIVAVGRDFTLWTPWTRPFNGDINMPIVRPADRPGVLFGDVFPAVCSNRMVTQLTDVVGSRPWNLAYSIVGAEEPVRPAVL